MKMGLQAQNYFINFVDFVNWNAARRVVVGGGALNHVSIW